MCVFVCSARYFFAGNTGGTVVSVGCCCCWQQEARASAMLAATRIAVVFICLLFGVWMLRAPPWWAERY